MPEEIIDGSFVIVSDRNGNKVPYDFRDGYDPKHIDTLIRYAVDGKTENEWMIDHKIPRRKVDQWIKNHTDFADAYDMAMTGLVAYWERISRGVASGKIEKGNGNLCQFFLKSLAPHIYQDRRIVENYHHVEETKLSPNASLKDAEALLRDMLKLPAPEKK